MLLPGHAAMYETLESSVSIIEPAGVLPLVLKSAGSPERGRAHSRGPARKIEHLVVPQAVELPQIIRRRIAAAAVGRALVDRHQQVAAFDVGEEILRPVCQ